MGRKVTIQDDPGAGNAFTVLAGGERLADIYDVSQNYVDEADTIVDTGGFFTFNDRTYLMVGTRLSASIDKFDTVLDGAVRNTMNPNKENICSECELAERLEWTSDLEGWSEILQCCVFDVCLWLLEVGRLDDSAG
ncbi:unnamed protein product [Dibothriocephalus latus]|uniref:Uncharacterized protein n=1 Tax=Dibothriocephalus latus TaxID=60516 RepID=A0A3P7NG62_DIBLA|nr:unnamed protein product [Dibothriocephalus latus]